jgi:hypothetical protein
VLSIYRTNINYTFVWSKVVDEVPTMPTINIKPLKALPTHKTDLPLPCLSSSNTTCFTFHYHTYPHHHVHVHVTIENKIHKNLSKLKFSLFYFFYYAGNKDLFYYHFIHKGTISCILGGLFFVFYYYFFFQFCEVGGLVIIHMRT